MKTDPIATTLSLMSNEALGRIAAATKDPKALAEQERRRESLEKTGTGPPLLGVPPCPFCGEYHLRVSQEDRPTPFRVECQYCGGSGPYQSTYDLAVEVWRNPMKVIPNAALRKEAHELWMPVQEFDPAEHRSLCLSRFPQNDRETIEHIYELMFVWPCEDGRQIHIFELANEHLLNCVRMLNRMERQHAEYTRRMNRYLNGPRPSGDGAQECFEMELKLLDPKPNPTDLLIYEPLVREITRRDLKAFPVE